MRVSNLQTGTFSGPVGSAVGQHRHRADLAVETAQPTRRLYTPSGGLVEAVLRASPDPTCMLAFWLVGFERRQSSRVRSASPSSSATRSGRGAPASGSGSRPIMTRGCARTWRS